MIDFSDILALRGEEPDKTAVEELIAEHIRKNKPSSFYSEVLGVPYRYTSEGEQIGYDLHRALLRSWNQS